jgi:cystathionine gamma-synthase
MNRLPDGCRACRTSGVQDLVRNPAWSEEDLGRPLPDSPHACSVALPTWDAVIGHEEGRDKVTRRLRAGYPRFVRNTLVERLFAAVREEVCQSDEDVLVLPTRAGAQRAQRFIERTAEVAMRVASYHGLQALVLPKRAAAVAWDYWRYSGEIVSSRRAADALGNGLREDDKAHLVRRRLARLVGVGDGDVHLFASGMAAVNSVHRALPGLRDGLKTLQIEFPYVDSLKIQELFGSGVVYLNRAEGESFAEALGRIRAGEFAGVFTEVPSNPLLRTADIPAIAEACREGGVPLVVDDSAAGPGNTWLLDLADVVTTSLTKWASGRGDVMAGMAIVRSDSAFAGEFGAALAEDASDAAPLYVADQEVLLDNLRGLRRRMATVNANGLALAGWLAGHPAVERVWHPSCTTRRRYDRVRARDGGYGGLLSFVLRQPRKATRVYDALELSKGPGFGTDFTLVCPYAQLAHYRELDWAAGCGVSPHLLRVSCGTERPEVLIGAFERALGQIR